MNDTNSARPPPAAPGTTPVSASAIDSGTTAARASVSDSSASISASAPSAIVQPEANQALPSAAAIGDRLLVGVEDDVLRVEHVVDRHGGERGLEALRIGFGRERLLLRLEHPLDQVLVAAELGAVAAHAAVEVARRWRR